MERAFSKAFIGQNSWAAKQSFSNGSLASNRSSVSRSSVCWDGRKIGENSGSGSGLSQVPSLSEKQYLSCMDKEGRIQCERELRISVYRRGVDPFLRKKVWKHLLNIFPPGLNESQRSAYLRSKSDGYQRLKWNWQSHPKDPEVDAVYNMVKKDVLRTDRSHPFYTGTGEENPHIIALLNILTTYALNHSLEYCQGMSDLVSPLYYVMEEEGSAYLCFVSLMSRLGSNFSDEGLTMSRKFSHLSRLLMHFDPEFYLYLKAQGAEDLLFTYRWILLELKREFPLDDALRMLEVLWASIPPSSCHDFSLAQNGYQFDPNSSKNGEKHFPPHQVLSGQSSLDALTLNLNGLGLNNHHAGNMDRFNYSAVHRRRQRMEHSVRLSGNYDLLVHNSSGRGSFMSSLGNLNNANSNEDHLHQIRTPRPIRTIRFLPKILSNDSKEIDSPEEEDFDRHKFSFPRAPAALINKEFSVDSIDRSNGARRAFQSFDSFGSIDSCPDCNSASMQSKNLVNRQTSKRMFERMNSEQGTMGLIVHCNGDDEMGMMIGGDPWGQQVHAPPRGLLLHQESNDSLKERSSSAEESSSGSNGSSGKEKERSEGYGSDNYVLSKSNSSSCSSLLLLNSTGSVVDSVSSAGLRTSTLPTPSELEASNAFMLFLCLSILLHHRDVIVGRKMDSNETAIYFDSLVRRQDVQVILDTSRHLFHSYLSQWHRSGQGVEMEQEQSSRYYSLNCDLTETNG